VSVYGVISDVHGNLQALTAVLGALDRSRVDRVVCLGDLVGYNGDSDACVALVRERGVEAIVGNHDLIALGRLGLERAAPQPAFALRRTRATLGPESRRFLAALPATRTYEGCVALFHGGVDDVCEYLSSAQRIEASAARLRARHPEARVCLHGHTHVPRLFEVRGGRALELPLEETVALHRGDGLCFVNPGSIDAARRPLKLAEYALFDSERWTVCFRRVGYDAEAAERRARAGGFRMGRAARALSRARGWLRAHV
jgi:predicted phosphodiesterase